MVARIGKQAPCPCKNGLKFGDCHGKAPEPFTNTLDQINADQRFNPTWDAMAAAGVPFEGVHLSFVSQDKRMRFVGDKLFRRPPEETYHEFILALLRSVVGLHWFQKQKKLPVEQQHQICRWFEITDAFLKLHRSKLVGEDKKHFSAIAPGDVSDLLTLAHDVFHLINARLFGGKIRKRLIDKRGFQGARYEIAVAALMIRAGLKVQYIYHHDKKHHDLQAFDKKTNTSLAVEVKSRHRAGGIHEPGLANMDHIKRGDVASLIGQALDQSPGTFPFVIFVDLNVPREPGTPVEARPWFQDVWTDMQSLGAPTPEHPDDFSAIFVTNFWHHWSGSALSAGVEYLHIVSYCPRHPVPADLVGRLMAAVQNYSFVPRQV